MPSEKWISDAAEASNLPQDVVAEVVAISDRREKCTVRDGNFVEPCWALEKLLEPNSSAKRSGVVSIDYFIRGKPSRSFIAVKSGEHRKAGFCFSYCPACGEDISAPFDRPATPPVAGSGAEG